MLIPVDRVDPSCRLCTIKILKIDWDSYSKFYYLGKKNRADRESARKKFILSEKNFTTIFRVMLIFVDVLI